MTDIAIRCEGLGKQYRIGERERYKALRDTIADTVSAPFRRLKSIRNSQPSTRNSEFWALKDISFEVKRGEVVGIIGRNGAGKSTLLKILSRITAPTTGEVKIHGRVGSLLEVGTGFHPELTGRENIYLNGAILGMKKVEIERKFDEIVAFAEIEKFINTPVKRYSSGMYVRLAFAVAAYMEPEILLVDEVLAVGDAAFQKKCLGKMQSVSQEGRTVILVSHNMGAIKRLCRKSIYLKQGHLQAVGHTDSVIGEYISQGLLAEGCVTWEEDDPNAGDKFLRLHSLTLRNARDESTTDFDFLEPILIEVDYMIEESAKSRLTLWIYSDDGVLLLVTGNDGSLVDIPLKEPGHYTGICEIPAHLLNNGRYFVSIRADIPNVKSILANESILNFEVHATNGLAAQRERAYGVICPPIEWEVQVQSECCV
jgi:lipopolysaccharide transport system ATP-binding protein